MLSCSIENTGIFLCLFIDGNGDTVGERLRERCRLGDLLRSELLRSERLRPERCGFIVGSIAAIYLEITYFLCTGFNRISTLSSKRIASTTQHPSIPSSFLPFTQKASREGFVK